MKLWSVCLLSLALSGPLAAGNFSTSGKVQMNHLYLAVEGTLNNDGHLIGTHSANLLCHTLAGSGVIKSPEVMIKAHVFAFTGVIDCSGKCMIIAKRAFDESLFTRRGGGEFIIVVDESIGKGDDRYNACKGLEYQLEEKVLFAK